MNKKEPFIYRLVEVLSEKMGSAFPELKTQKQLIQNLIKEEEASFLKKRVIICRETTERPEALESFHY